MSDRDLFIAALDHPDPVERAAWLDGACAGDTDRRRRVDVLLKAHDEASRFLADPAGRPVGPDDPTATAYPAAPSSPFDVRTLLKPAERVELLGTLDHYEVIEEVGRGGMGVVLKAFDPKLHRLVALKVMAPHLAAHGAARKRFEREARAVAAVKNEHVVAIHAVQTNDPVPYLVMEFVGGISVQDRLDRRGAAEVKEVLRIGMQAARGLAAAHAQGVVHRDVKPANILLENGIERVKLTDFGLARVAADVSLTQSGVITGTPNYMSPEQAAGRPTDARSDLFSLGGVLYALCTGHPPFRAETPLAVLRRVCDDPVRPPREVNPDVPDWLDAIVRKLLAKEPADRFQSAAEVADLLGQHLAHLQQPTAVPMPPTVTVPGSGDRIWRQIFEATDRDRRVWQHGMILSGLVLIGLAVIMAVISGGLHAILLAPGLIGLALIAVGGLERQQWDVPYKGRTIRFENSPFTGERLFVDGVRIARGGFGRMRELRGTIPVGPGAGDEARALCEAGLLSFKCRISVSEGGPIAPATAMPAAEAGRPTGLGWLLVIGGLMVLELVWKSRESFWQGYFRPGYYAPISMLVTSAILLAVLWWCRRRPEPAWYRGILTLAMAVVVAGTGAGLLASWGEGPYLDKLAGATTWQTAGFVGAAALVVVTNLIRAARWVAFGNAPRDQRAKVGVVVLIAMIPLAAVVVAWWAVATGRWVPWTLPVDDVPTVGQLRIVKDDPDAEVIVERPGDRMIHSDPGGRSSHTVSLSPGVLYTLSIHKGGHEVHSEVIRLAAGEQRQLHISPIVVPEKTIQLKPKVGSFPADALRMEFSPDRSTLAVEQFIGSIVVFDAATGEERFTLHRPQTHFTAFGFTPDSGCLSYLTQDTRDAPIVVRTVDVRDGKPVVGDLKPKEPGGFSNSHALAYSPDGKRLAVSVAHNADPDNRWESRILRWELARDASGPRELAPLESQDGMIGQLRFTPNGSQVLAVAGTHTWTAWNWETGRPARRNDPEVNFTYDRVATGGPVDAVAGWGQLSRQPSVLFSERWPQALVFVTAPDLGAVGFACLAVSADGKLGAAGGKGSANGRWEERPVVRVWDTAARRLRAILLGHADWPLAVAFDPTETGLVTAGKDGTVRTWRLP